MVRVGIVVVVVWYTAIMIINLVACTPWPNQHGKWLDRSLVARCFGTAPTLMTAGAYMNVVTDFYILFIPMHQVPRLGLSRKKKIGVGFIFLTGLL